MVSGGGDSGWIKDPPLLGFHGLDLNADTPPPKVHLLQFWGLSWKNVQPRTDAAPQSKEGRGHVKSLPAW